MIIFTPSDGRKIVAGIVPGTTAADAKELCIGHWLVRIEQVDAENLTCFDLRQLIDSKPKKPFINLKFVNHSGSEYSLQLKIDDGRPIIDQPMRDFACFSVLNQFFTTEAISDLLDVIVLTSSEEMSVIPTCHNESDCSVIFVLSLIFSMRHTFVYLWRGLMLQKRILLHSDSALKVSSRSLAA